MLGIGIILPILLFVTCYGRHPIVINTWKFTNAAENAWSVLSSKGSALDAVEKGCTVCEIQQCGFGVGYGGKPDESGETTLDAAIMDGVRHDVGAVGGLRRVSSAISVARAVLDHTSHTLIVGDSATAFAKEMGFKETDLHTNRSIDMWNSWRNKNCQPNFRENVIPDPAKICGPYKANHSKKHGRRDTHSNVSPDNHDTIGMLAMDSQGNLAAGTSTNGLGHKISGRVGDSPIPGSGYYVDNEIGAASATGNGDIMMRFVPSYQTVEFMRQGNDPSKAAMMSLQRIKKHYPHFRGALIAINTKGEYGAACNGMETFPFAVRTVSMTSVQIKIIKCQTMKEPTIG